MVGNLFRAFAPKKEGRFRPTWHNYVLERYVGGFAELSDDTEFATLEDARDAIQELERNTRGK